MNYAYYSGIVVGSMSSLKLYNISRTCVYKLLWSVLSYLKKSRKCLLFYWNLFFKYFPFTSQQFELFFMSTIWFWMFVGCVLSSSCSLSSSPFSSLCDVFHALFVPAAEKGLFLSIHKQCDLNGMVCIETHTQRDTIHAPCIRYNSVHIYWYFELWIVWWACAMRPKHLFSLFSVHSQPIQYKIAWMSLLQTRVQSTYVSISFSLPLTYPSDVNTHTVSVLCRTNNAIAIISACTLIHTYKHTTTIQMKKIKTKKRKRWWKISSVFQQLHAYMIRCISWMLIYFHLVFCMWTVLTCK